MQAKTGLLFINLGTPEAPTRSALKPYLRQFLSDKRVLNIPAAARALLVNAIIVPTRSGKSAEAYTEVWRTDGSPLRVFTEGLVEQVKTKIGSENLIVRYAMRYGEPSIDDVIRELSEQNCERLIVFPLYPHYASSSAGTALEDVFKSLSRLWAIPSVYTIPPFYERDEWIDAQVEVARDALHDFGPDHTLFSFHGLPIDHLTGCDASNSHCQKVKDCCLKRVDANRLCYGMQTQVTAELLARKLGLQKDEWSVAYQSRLAGKPWIGPFTDVVVPELAQKGVKKLAMFSPAFVADCLETLEELGMRAKEDFEEAGGEDFYLAPCVNDSNAWVDGAIALVGESGWI